MGTGMYHFIAETDPEEIAAAAERFQEFSQRFDVLRVTVEQYGFDSVEGQVALIEYKQWQQGRRSS